MDKALNCAEILTQVLKREAAIQPRLKTLKVNSVCDPESGQFLIIMTGWENNTWVDTILFHAYLFDDKIVIEEDNFEDGLTTNLIQAGIPPERIVNGLSLQST